MVPGRSWAAWARALGLLLPRLDVADLGCGEGYVARLVADAGASSVFGVYASSEMVRNARIIENRIAQLLQAS